MKSILRILVLGAVPILAVTMTADQALAADEGSQLIFQANLHPDFKSYISVTNTDEDQAVTVLVQYYNDAMELVIWYLNVIPGGGNVLVNPFDHTVPGSETNTGDFITGTGKANSGQFVIAVTAVGANVAVEDVENGSDVVNVLFPGFLAEDMHGTDNIDNCGSGGIQTSGTAHLVATETDGEDDCSDADTSTANVGDLNIDNAEPIGFNNLTGHFTEALLSNPVGGADQTASWGGTPVIRTAVGGTDDDLVRNYQTLDDADGTAGDTGTGGHLSEELAGGTAATATIPITGTYTAAQDDVVVRSAQSTVQVNGGGLVLPALHGGGAETSQAMLFLSAADDFGGAGSYKLIPAKTGYSVTVNDNAGGTLDDPAAASGPVFGGADDPETPAGTKIIVEGIRVMTDAGDCDGDLIDGAWTLGHLTSIVPTASTGHDGFAGLGVELMPATNASPGFIKFNRTNVKCEGKYGDGDLAEGNPLEEPDGVPTTDNRTYEAGTLIVEEKDESRSFVTTGRAVLVFVTQTSTFGASWTLKPTN